MNSLLSFQPKGGKAKDEARAKVSSTNLTLNIPNYTLSKPRINIILSDFPG